MIYIQCLQCMPELLNRRRFITAGVAAGTTLLAGCAGDGDETTESPSMTTESQGMTTENQGMTTESQGNSGGQDYQSTLSVPSLNIVYFARMQNGFNEAVQERDNFSGTFNNSRGSQSEQISDLQTALSNDLDFMMAVPIRAEALTPTVEQANDQDVPFIAVDRNVSGADPATYVASDNVSLGRRSVELLHGFMQDAQSKDEYNIVELQGTQGASVTNERQEGGMEYVNNNSINVLGSQTGEFSTETAVGVMEDFVTRYGDDIDGVYAHNDLMALGAHQALSGTELEDVAITGIDGSEAWVNLFSDNQYYGTIAQLPEEMIRTAIDMGIKAVEGEDLEDSVQIEGLEVTGENASDYLNQYF